MDFLIIGLLAWVTALAFSAAGPRVRSAAFGMAEPQARTTPQGVEVDEAARNWVTSASGTVHLGLARLGLARADLAPLGSALSGLGYGSLAAGVMRPLGSSFFGHPFGNAACAYTSRSVQPTRNRVAQRVVARVRRNSGQWVERYTKTRI
ncbi:MAG: hypothetical protein AAGJ32_11380 [Pseudomonadota bacterium]